MLQFFDALLGLYTGRTQDASTPDEGSAGQGLVEYALILSFIAIAVILSLVFFGGRLTTLYSTLASSIPT